MKKLTLLAACALTCLAAHGATVNWQAGVDTGFATSTSAALAQGNYIRLGYFTISDVAVQALALPTVVNVAALDTNFVQFGQAQVGDLVVLVLDGGQYGAHGSLQKLNGGHSTGGAVNSGKRAHHTDRG